MSISSDEYKEVICSLTNEECIDGDCGICEVLKDHDAEIIRNNIQYFTVFTTKGNLQGIPISTNVAHVIGLIDKQRLNMFREKALVGFAGYPYNPIDAHQYNHLLTPFQKYNCLGLPDEMWIKKDAFGVFRWGEQYYIFAPRVDF